MKKEFSDTEIIIGCKEQNETIIKYLVDTYRTRMMGIAYNIIKEVAPVEDIVQEAFIKFINSINKINECGHNVFARLYTITKNLCIDYKRRKQSITRQKNNLKTVMNDWKTFNDSVQERNIIIEEIRDIINNHLNGMVKLFCIDKYIYGLNTEEISKKYKCPSGTVGRRLYNGRNIIRPYIKNIAVTA